MRRLRHQLRTYSDSLQTPLYKLGLLSVLGQSSSFAGFTNYASSCCSCPVAFSSHFPWSWARLSDVAGHRKAWREFSWRGGGGTRLASKVTPLFASLTNMPPARFFELWASILDDLTPKRRQLGPSFERDPRWHHREGQTWLMFLGISLEKVV